MFLFILETVQYVITQNNSAFIIAKEQLYPFPTLV